MSHDLVILHKFGEATGLPLRSATCTCGWRSGVWYATDENLRNSFALHTDAVAKPVVEVAS